MRQIKFRAKRTDGRGWAYGYFVKTPITAEFNDCHGAFFDSSSAEKTEWAGRYCIVTDWGVAHEVDRNTLGQHTGIRDIYEGDIITNGNILVDGENPETGQIIWDEPMASFA